MTALIGTYECKIDDKGRLMLPMALKKQLASSFADGFVLKRAVFQNCLELFTMAEWDAMMNKVNQLNRFKKSNNDFIRRFTAGVRVLDVDASGRILVPKDLYDFAGLSKEIVLSSAINILEIWDKNKYEQAIDDATGSFADLAEQVMGNDSNHELS